MLFIWERLLNCRHFIFKALNSHSHLVKRIVIQRFVEFIKRRIEPLQNPDFITLICLHDESFFTALVLVRRFALVHGLDWQTHLLAQALVERDFRYQSAQETDFPRHLSGRIASLRGGVSGRLNYRLGDHLRRVARFD